MARLILSSGEAVGLASGTYTVFGTSTGSESVSFGATAQVTFDASFNAGGDTITLDGNAGDYTVVRSGSQVILTNAAGGSFTIPVGTAGATIAFDDGSRTLAFNSAAGQIELGDQAVTSTAAAVTAGSGGATPEAGLPFTLTTSADFGSDFTGGTGSDTFTGLLSGTAANVTIGSLDVINGGLGTDTFLILDETGGQNIATAAPLFQMSAIENIEIRSVGAATQTFTGAGIADVAQINVTQAAAATITAKATQSVDVSGATGAITVDGGLNVDVTAAAGQTVDVGSGTAASGVINVTSAALGAGVLETNGGTDVTVTASGQTTGRVDVGDDGAAADLASGAIVVNATGAAYTAAGAVTLGAIETDGGSTVVVTQVAASSTAAAAADGAAANRTQSAVTVDGGASTTSVSVSQDAAVTAVNAVAAVAAVNEVTTVTFNAASANDVITVGGLSFTASVNLTAAQVAAAFANLSAGDTVGSSVLGTYSGAFQASTSSGAVATTAAGVSTVAFTGVGNTAVAAATHVDNNAVAVAGIATVITTNGVNAVAAVTGVMGVVGGAIVVDDNATSGSITEISLDGYGAASDITDADALTSLSLSNSAQGITVDAAVTSLTLNVDGITGGAAIDLDDGAGANNDTITSLVVNSSGTASAIAVEVAAATSLTVNAASNINLTGSTYTALTGVTLTGSANITADFSAAAALASTNASGASGTNTITLNATTSTYTGGSGADAVTLSAAAPTKAVSLGAGNDTLNLATGTTSATGALDGGAGDQDVIAFFKAEDAGTATATALFEAQISGFERASFGATAAGATIDLANLDDISYITLAANAAAVNIDSMANGGTVVVTGAQTATLDIDLLDATGTSDSLNISTVVSTADVNIGTIDITGVEAVSIVATDTSTAAGIQTATLSLTDANLTSVTVSGNGALALTAGAAVTTINGSAMTGALTAGSNTVATTITGGSGNDTLTANVSGDVLVGGAGSDTLVVNADLVTLTGGAGDDIFDVSAAVSNSNSYATIDADSGDSIILDAAIASHASTAVSLAATASFGDYVDAAVVAAGSNGSAWFQFGGDTYLVNNVGAADVAFTNGTDIIVQLDGLVDLSTATLNTTDNQLFIA